MDEALAVALKLAAGRRPAADDDDSA